MEKIKEFKNNTFEQIKHMDEDGNEYWLARELQLALQYNQWRNFELVINKAKENCANSNINILDHFADISKTIEMPKNAIKQVNDYKVSRYGCYLIMLNADASKKVIALGKTYFAIQTRKQELSNEEYSLLDETDKRFYIRNQTKSGNWTLNRTAVESGVKDLAKFHNAGYKGLYKETADQIFKRKKLRYREDILDNMGSDELIANLFRISQTNGALKKQQIKTEKAANKLHNKIGKAIRKVIQDAGNTLPEELPLPDKSLKVIEKEQNKLLIENKNKH